MTQEFKELIDYYVDAERKRGKKETTITGEAQNAASFLFHMQQKGCKFLKNISEEDVLSFFVSESGERIRSCSYRKNISAVFKAGQEWKETECAISIAEFPVAEEVFCR